MVSSTTDNAKRGNSAASANSADMPPAPVLPGRRTRPLARPALSKDAIVQAAIEVLQTEGVDGLSMRLVAKRLGTGAASLYVHVSNKDELLELIFDALVSQVPIPVPDPAHWQDQLRDVATGLRDVLRTNSQVALAGLGRIPTSFDALAGAEGMLAILQAGGLPPRVVGLAADLLALYIIAGVFEESLYERRGMSDKDMADYADEIHRFYSALPPNRFPILSAMAADLTAGDGDDRFQFGLDVLIAGLIAVGQRG
jgi:AcrR family transcriptional regulator